MNSFSKAAAALLVGLGALGLTAASAEDRGRDRDRNHRERDHRDHDRRDDDRRDSNHRAGDNNRRSDDHRGSDDRRAGYGRDDHRRDDRRTVRRDDHRGHQRYASSYRPVRCTLDHDHRYHDRNYYNYYSHDRYYSADPGFSISLSFGNGYYDRAGAYYHQPYYDRRGYRASGRVVNRDVFNLRGYRADAVLIEEIYPGRRGSDLVCTVTARGPDARYVPYGQLRALAERNCSRRAEIRVYA